MWIACLSTGFLWNYILKCRHTKNTWANWNLRFARPRKHLRKKCAENSILVDLLLIISSRRNSMIFTEQWNCSCFDKSQHSLLMFHVVLVLISVVCTVVIKKSSNSLVPAWNSWHRCFEASFTFLVTSTVKLLIFSE
jgi:hypothetical protein